MNFRFRSLTLTAVALSTLALSAGCEVSKCETEDGQDATCAESLERYTRDGSDQTYSEAYEPGMNVVVDNIKGDIFVRPGNAGVVEIVASPFTYRGHSKDTEAGDDITNGWSGTIEAADGQITFITYQQGGWDEVGTTLTVFLPPEFDGALRVVNQGAGNLEEADIDISDDGAGSPLGSAHSLTVESMGLGECNINGVPSVTSTTASCRGEIEITNVSDNVTAHADGIASDSDPYMVRVSFAGISADATGGEISTTEGHVELNMPADGNFQITAAPNEDGVVNIADVPDGCEASDNVVSCGTADASYIVNAGTDDTFDPANVNIDFQ